MADRDDRVPISCCVCCLLPFLHLPEILPYSFDIVLSYDTVKTNKISESSEMQCGELDFLKPAQPLDGTESCVS